MRAIVGLAGLVGRVNHPAAEWREHREQWNLRSAVWVRQSRVGVAAALAVVVAVGYLALKLWWHPVQINLRPYAAMGLVLGERTANLLPEHGSIVLIDWKPDPIGRPMLDAVMSNFQKAQKPRHLFVLATTTVGGGGTPMGGNPLWGMPVDFFLRTAEEYSSADAIISFVGVPHLTSEQIAKLQERPHPKFFAVSSSRSGVKSLLQGGVMQLVVVPRPITKDMMANQPKQLPECFDRYFEIVTPKNASTLPD